MRHSTSRELFHYWNKLRSNRPAPLRPEFEPSAVGDILGSIFMLEMMCDIAEIRLAGGNICSMFGEDLRGKAFAKLWLNGVERKPSTIASRCIDDMVPYLLRADGLTRTGSVSEIELLMIPLMGNNGQSNRVVGSLSDLDQDNPCVKKHLIGMSLTSIKPIAPDTIPVDFRKDRRPKIKKAPEDDIISGKHLKKNKHLYIIDGGVSS